MGEGGRQRLSNVFSFVDSLFYAEHLAFGYFLTLSIFLDVYP